MSTPTSSRWLARLLALAIAWGSAGCGAAAGPEGAEDASRQSNSEYDVARDLWLNRNQPRAALQHALKAVELDDENAEAAHLVSLLYLQFCALQDGGAPEECRLKSAEEYARRAVEADPNFREAQNTLGVVLVHAKRYRDAVQVLEPLTQDILYQSPENAWGNLGWAYLQMGRVDPAIDALQRSIAAQPSFCVGHYRLGLAFEKKQDWKSAQAAFTSALETEHPACKRLQDGWLARARVSLRLTNRGEAQADLEQCVTLGKATKTGKECRSLLARIE